MLRLYIIGIAILIIAILANGIAIKLGFKTWYDFLSLLNEAGLDSLRKLSLIDYFWLCLVYPSVLGFGYWTGQKIYELIF